MECRDYIVNLLSAHADGELGGSELRRAEEHVARCERCRARLADERELKAVIRRSVRRIEAPAQVREGVLRALDQEAAARNVSKLRRPAVWVPLALAASIALVFVSVRTLRNPVESEQVTMHPGGVPDFDVAIAKFESFNRRFRPNVPSDSFGDIAGAYVDAHMPGYIWNFNGSGLQLIGGRLDKLSDGRAVTYTFYKGDGAAILCMRYKVSDAAPPAGAVQEIGGHLFYTYYGYSICYSYSPVGDFVCLLVTHQTINELLQSVVVASE